MIHDIKFEKGFIENVDQHSATVYSDTDSMYLRILVNEKFKKEFNKYNKVYWKDAIELALKISKDINDSIQHIMSEGQIGQRAGFDSRYQRFYFKTEIVALRMILFNVKKTYALNYVYDEGVYLEKPVVKKTGGLVKKSNVPKISKMIFEEIYNVLLEKEFDSLSEIEVYIFDELFKKYKDIFSKGLKELDWKLIGFPNKYGFGGKTVTKWVWGARFFNTFFQDKLRPGDSLYSLYITYNENKLKKLLAAHADKNKLDQSLVDKKYDMISIAIEDADVFKDTWKKVLDYLEEEIELKISFDKNFSNEIVKKFHAFKAFF